MLVSIVAVCYNHSQFVVSTLNSFIRQTYPIDQIEIFIVDDASTDNSVVIIEDWIKNNKVKCEFVPHKKNIGLTATLNETITKCKGGYVQLIACDDVLKSEKLQKQIQYLEANPDFALCCSNFESIDEYGAVIENRYFPEDYIFPDDAFSAILSGHEGLSIVVHSPTVLVRKNILLEMMPYPEHLLQEDFYMWLNIAAKYKVGFNDEVFVSYRKLSSSLSNCLTTEKRIQYLKGLIWVIDDLKEKNRNGQTRVKLDVAKGQFTKKMFAAKCGENTSKKALMQIFKETINTIESLDVGLELKKSFVRDIVRQFWKNGGALSISEARKHITRDDVILGLYYSVKNGTDRIRTQIKKLLKSVFVKKKLPNSYGYISSVVNKSIGLELGGVSKIFGNNGHLPIYSKFKRLDNCNFSSNTIWQGQIDSGKNYAFNNKGTLGNQYILDATNLKGIEDGKYDVVMSSHVLEHIANPIKALMEWKRVLKEEGTLVLVVPDKDKTFDRKRPVTKLKHLIYDFEKNTDESDTSHFEEILALHDIEFDEGVENLSVLQERLERNFEQRTAHHHTFSFDLLKELSEYCGFKTKCVEKWQPCHLILVVEK